MSLEEFKVMVTGHRPDKLFGYNIRADAYTPLRQQIDTVLLDIQKEKQSVACISGMALGADTIFAEEAIKLGLRLLAYIPFKEQSRVWNPADQKHWRDLLDMASFIHITGVLSKGADKWEVSRLLQKRNCDMVDTCDRVIGIWNGDRNGGTFNCLRYAKEKNKEIIIINPKTNVVTLLGGATL